MLQQLHIENVAVIERADIDFSEGFSALTGETGAGKSILIDSINALLGERTSKEIVRSGCERAFVSAMFSVNPDAKELTASMQAFGIEPEDGMLLLQREIHADGRSVSRINARQCTASVLKEIGHLLVNVHGQQDSAFLLNPQKHLQYLDAFAKNEAFTEAYGADYREVCRLRKELEKLDTDEQQKARRLDMLTYQINEIEAAGLRSGEEEELTERRKLLVNAEKISDILYRARDYLKDRDGSVSELMYDIRRSLSSLSPLSDGFNAVAEKAQSLAEELEDLAETVYDLQRESDFSPRELDEVETRLDLINRLERKYGKDIASVLEYLDKAKSEYDEINLSDERKKELGDLLAKAEIKLKKSSSSLTESRVKAAEILDKEIIEQLSFLDMPGARFITSVLPKPYSPQGADEVQFLLSVNVGEEPRPLSKIASGGELSRIMLGIRNVLSVADPVETLIFDEIDTGVSGRAAQKIAYKLRSMASRCQVFSVTHLAQIAAYAEHQYLIEKHNDGVRTYTEITLLDRDGRIREIGRLLGGADLTASVLQTAEEMIDNAR